MLARNNDPKASVWRSIIENDRMVLDDIFRDGEAVMRYVNNTGGGAPRDDMLEAGFLRVVV